ncbi:MAG: hypothetical protein ACFFD4_10970 [Candidatus Odinarchaeota archaeon]
MAIPFLLLAVLFLLVLLSLIRSTRSSLPEEEQSLSLTDGLARSAGISFMALILFLLESLGQLFLVDLLMPFISLIWSFYLVFFLSARKSST